MLGNSTNFFCQLVDFTCTGPEKSKFLKAASEDFLGSEVHVIMSLKAL